MAEKKAPLDPQLQELVDRALASGDPMGFINELTQQIQGDDDGVFEGNPRIELPDPPLHPSLITVRIDIVGAQPPVWRRLEVRGDLTLDEVHEHLQAAFGWLNSHLHQFETLGGERRGAHFVTDFDIEEGETGTHERDARLDQVLRNPAEKLGYIYDFGDFWEHQLTVESVRPATDDDPAAKCTGGRGACPPENVGGIHTWNELAAALRTDPDPSHLTGDFEMYAGWLPENCAPDDFSVDEANEAISLVGLTGDEIVQRFEQSDAGRLPLELPEPRTELAELLGRCSTEVVDMLARVAHRALSLDDAVSDDEIHTMLRPWQALLDTIGDNGVQLTGAGWMPPAAVQQVWQDSGFTSSYGKANREQNTHQVKTLREEGVRAGLVRKNKGRLLLTMKGRQCRDSQDELLSAIAHSLVSDKHDIVQDAYVISLLFLAADWQIGAESRWAAHAAERGEPLRAWEVAEAFWDDVAHMLNEVGWRLGDGCPLHRDDLGYETHRAVGLLGIGGSPLELPRSAPARKVARAALFE